MSKITCFLPYLSEEQIRPTIENLKKEPLISEIFPTETPVSTASIRSIAERSSSEFTLIYTKHTTLRFGAYSLERMTAIAEDTAAGLVYSDHFRNDTPAPLIDYQSGSLRDDFDFGSVLLYNTAALKEAVSRMDKDYRFAGLYDLRLKVSQKASLQHIPEYLYYDIENDLRLSGEKLFDYVDPKNRGVQIEMEQALTQHLKDIGAWLPPVSTPPSPSTGPFEYEASVVIPCKNRRRTIGDAIRSALNQKTDFKYNVIVVDDNSDDGTVDIIKEHAYDPKLIYVAQDRSWHAIGGNWNAALHHPLCGRYALQLDSDDVYSDENTVQKFVDAFRSQNCAMVIGTYRLTDIDLNTIPPGIIDHKEWTPENGHNNALRINGLGAPRGFYTPLLRTLNFPPTKYGEDYAVGLRICRDYKIGRIYDVMYNCRRWDNNSDAALSAEKVNINNFYKDKIRTWELKARMQKMLKTI